MDRMRPRLSGYVGIYREVDFTIDRVSAAKLQIDTTVMPANTLERNHSISVNIDERLQRGGDAVVEPSKTGTGMRLIITNYLSASILPSARRHST